MKALVLAIVLATCAIAHADKTPSTTEGKAYFADGQAAAGRKDYAAASRAFAAGYEIEKWDGFLFAWAQVERMAGNCEKAVQLYSRFIWTEPAEQTRKHALGWIEQCGGKLLDKPPEPAPDPVTPPEPEPIKQPEPVQPPPPVKPPPVERQAPGFQHKLAIGLGVGALAATGVAIWGLHRSGNDFDRAEAAVVYKDVEKFRDRAEERLLIARISIGVGIGLATATVLRVVLQDRAPRTEVIPTGNGIALRRSF